MLVLPIAHTWDGLPAGPDEAALVRLTGDATHVHLAVDAPFHGDPPPPAPPGPTWALWEHEVVELFVVGPGDRYLEVELGPHGHQLLLHLDGRRHVTACPLPLPFAPTRAAARWRAALALPRALLPAPPHRVNAYAIHGAAPARRRYLAHAPVPGPAPDFHRLDAFPAARLP